LSTDVSEARTASIIRDTQYNPEDNSEHHTRRRENLKSHIVEGVSEKFTWEYLDFKRIKRRMELREFVLFTK
jgi:hypothetical protein